MGTVNKKMTAIADNIRAFLNGVAYTNLADPTSADWLVNTRISSSGTTKQSNKTTTNMIYCKKGDVVRVKGVSFVEIMDRVSLDSAAGGSYRAPYVSTLPDDEIDYSFDGNVHQFTIIATASAFDDAVFRFSFDTPPDTSAVIITVNEEIADNGEVALLSLDQMAEKIPEVYANGKTEGITEGKQVALKEFWGHALNNGNGQSYVCTFGGNGWNKDNFFPQHDIKVKGSAYMMFREHAIDKTPYDLVERLDSLGVKLDFSECTIAQYTFYNANFTRLPVLDFRNVPTLSTTFSYVQAVTIDKIIVSASTKYSSGAFDPMGHLENLTIEGEIGQDGFNIKGSTKLSKASWYSIIDALSPTTTGLTITGSLASVRKAFETVEDHYNGDTSEEWTNLVNTKPNWTISLV